jgi:hypothetical protein
LASRTTGKAAFGAQSRGALTTTSTTTRNQHGGREVFAERETRGAAAVASSGGFAADESSAFAGALSDAHIQQLTTGDADHGFQFIAVATSPRFQPWGSLAGSSHGCHE